MMTRGKRIALELLAPAPLGLLVFIVPLALWRASEAGRIFPLVPGIVVGVGGALYWAYIFTALPSVTFAVLVECAFARGLNPASKWAVAWTTLLGAAAGGAVAFELTARSSPPDRIFFLFAWMMGVGLAVGFVIGNALHRFARDDAGAKPKVGFRAVVIAGPIALPTLGWLITRNEAPWLTMWTIALAEFYALKFLTLVEYKHPTRVGRTLAYLALWPGLNADEFFGERAPPAEWTRTRVLIGALVNIACGATLLGWALKSAKPQAAPLLVGWVGMVGLILLLHFGVFRLAAWVWCRLGVNAPPIMRTPIAATSLAEFWSERWNLAFAETARRFLFRPLARRVGARPAGAVVFLISGLIHESVLSLPAFDGWGGPTLYFALQALGIAAEKSGAGRRIGLGRGWRGWLWTLGVTVAPVSLLFHTPFVTRVFVPFLHQIALILL